MISYLKGKIIFKGEKFIILDVSGVGYKVFLSPRTLNKIPQKGEILKVFCFLNVRENLLDLYGFLDFKELELFEILNDIPGIGPKAAITLASFGSLENLKKAIESQGSKFYQEVKGIGKKKIQKILLELTGKMKEFNKSEAFQPDEALEALVSLGFSPKRAKEVLSKIPKEIEDPEQKIKDALKLLG